MYVYTYTLILTYTQMLDLHMQMRSPLCFDWELGAVQIIDKWWTFIAQCMYLKTSRLINKPEYIMFGLVNSKHMFYICSQDSSTTNDERLLCVCMHFKHS